MSTFNLPLINNQSIVFGQIYTILVILVYYALNLLPIGDCTKGSQQLIITRSATFNYFKNRLIDGIAVLVTV